MDLPPSPPGAAPEREMLGAYLDWLRAVAVRKVEGLTRAQAVSTPTVSALSPLGVVRHLAYVERWWFQRVLAHEDVEMPPGEEDFTVGDDETVASVVDLYRRECEVSRHLTDAHDLDAHLRHPKYASLTLRWVLLHMIEETARHCGHLDLLRESIDGATGD